MPRPSARNASKTPFTMSARLSLENGHSGDVTLKFEYFESKRQNPSWCLVVKMTYLKPSSFAAFAHFAGSNRTGLKALASPMYWRLNSSESFVQSTSRRDHLASPSLSGHDSVRPMVE